jgi:hypothetical protein
MKLNKNEIKFITILYDLVGEDQFKTENMYNIGGALNLDKNESLNLSLYLKDLGLIKFVNMNGGIGITSSGIWFYREKIKVSQ